MLTYQNKGYRIDYISTNIAWRTEMKKGIFVFISIILLCIIPVSACACEDATSTAIEFDDLIREDYAKNMEAEHDKTRVHPVDIPEGAETVTVDGEVYQVIRTINEFEEKIYRTYLGNTENYILGCDLDIADFNVEDYKSNVFSGKFNGNNYKIYSTEKDGGLRSSLFYKVENAFIENIIFSASDGAFAADANGIPEFNYLLIYYCIDSIVRNCISYWQPAFIARFNDKNFSVGGLIHYTNNSEIQNCINYGDLYIGNGAPIVDIAYQTNIINCKNYGNITGELKKNHGGTGGIVNHVNDGCVIDSCDNYGKIGGTSRVGGIVGFTGYGGNSFDYLNKTEYPNTVIKNCNNYGDIYLMKREGAKIFDQVTDEEFPNVFCVGGVAGSATKIENCNNEGNFYGFEKLGKGIKVDYSGGVVGIALEVNNCNSKNSILVQKGKSLNVGEIYGILI